MDSVWGAGHDVCKPLQFGLLTTCCVALLVRCRVIRPHVPDQLPQEFQEHVTYLHGPDMWRNVNTFVNYGAVLRAATKLIFRLGRLNLRTCKSWTADNNTAQNSATYQFRYFVNLISEGASLTKHLQILSLVSTFCLLQVVGRPEHPPCCSMVCLVILVSVLFLVIPLPHVVDHVLHTL